MSNTDDFESCPTWEIAAQKSSGYENPRTVEIYLTQMVLTEPWNFTKSDLLTEREFQLLAIISRLVQKRKVVSIVDFGGGNGYMCHFLRAWIPETQINYTIIESSGIVSAYTKFADKSRIKWQDNLMSEKFDIAIISSTLQYLEQPEIILKNLMKFANDLVILRYPELKGKKTKFAIQGMMVNNNSERITIPVHFFGQGFLDSIVSSYFNKVMTFYHHNEKLSFENEVITLKGFLFSR